MRTRIFLSWCHQDKALKEALLRDLLPALGVFTDLAVEWWDDSHLTCGEELPAGILARLDEADFGLLLLSTRYFGRSSIRQHELPRFAGPSADKGSLPVALSRYSRSVRNSTWAASSASSSSRGMPRASPSCPAPGARGSPTTWRRRSGAAPCP